MAYGVKYRCTFKDYANVTILAEILQDDFAGSVTDILGIASPLSIRWAGDRGDIFNPIRGGLATFSFYAQSNNQFDEFFGASTKEYQLRVTVAGSVYWTGYLMLSDYYESLHAAPYVVTVKAYDLGCLQDIPFSPDREDDDRVIDVINYCLSQTGFSFSVKERVNIYDDSINKTSSDSLFDQINVHQPLYMDNDWYPDSCYEVLRKELMPFNAFIMQENGVWNICRVQDMKREHYYRVFNTSGTITSSGTEDTITTMPDIMNMSGLMMAADSWKNLNFYQDYGYKNLVNNGHFNPNQSVLTDFWTKSTSFSAGINTIYGGTPGSLYIEGRVSPPFNTLTHDKTYVVESGNALRLMLRYRLRARWAGSASGVNMGIKIEHDDGAGTVNILDIETGEWNTSPTYVFPVDNSIANKEWTEGEVLSEAFPDDGTITIKILAPAASGTPSQFYGIFDYVEVLPVRAGGNELTEESYFEEINSENFTDPDDVRIYHGDSLYTDTGADLHLGSYKTTGGATTDAWQSMAGSPEDTIAQLCADCYKAQYSVPARRIQATLFGDVDYLDVLKDSSDRCYLAASFTRNFRENMVDGEWIEIKTGWGDNLCDDFYNGIETGGGATPYDTFSETDNEVSLEKTQTAAGAYCTIVDIPVTDGCRYLVTAEVVDNGSSDMPELQFAGDTTQLVEGTNSYEVVSDTTDATHDGYIVSGVADTCDLTITLTIQEGYGL